MMSVLFLTPWNWSKHIAIVVVSTKDVFDKKKYAQAHTDIDDSTELYWWNPHDIFCSVGPGIAMYGPQYTANHSPKFTHNYFVESCA